jgi:NAD(P)H dehydrogenase (quinone)
MITIGIFARSAALNVMFSLIILAQSRPSVLVVYYSPTGHTKAMAEAVAAGARAAGQIDVNLKTVSEASTAEVLSADAIIVGTPVHNANVAPPVQEFINKWPFEGSPMKDKIGAAFVSAGGISAGEELTQMNVLHSMLVYGMIVVGGPDWKQPFGASAITNEGLYVDASKDGRVDKYFLEKAEALGNRVAVLTARLKNKN